jgi:hypothetical protein
MNKKTTFEFQRDAKFLGMDPLMLLCGSFVVVLLIFMYKYRQFKANL